MKKHLRLLLSLLVFALISCATTNHNDVDIKDITVYVDLGANGAHYAHTLTSVTGDLTKAQWDAIRGGLLSMSADDFTDIQTSIEQLCTEVNICDYETQQKIMQVISIIKSQVAKARAVQNKYRYYQTRPEMIKP